MEMSLVKLNPMLVASPAPGPWDRISVDPHVPEVGVDLRGSVWQMLDFIGADVYAVVTNGHRSPWQLHYSSRR